MIKLNTMKKFTLILKTIITSYIVSSQNRFCYLKFVENGSLFYQKYLFIFIILEL